MRRPSDRDRELKCREGEDEIGHSAHGEVDKKVREKPVKNIGVARRIERKNVGAWPEIKVNSLVVARRDINSKGDRIGIPQIHEPLDGCRAK